MKINLTLKFLCFIFVSMVATTSFAYCVYNSTNGNDTLRYSRFEKYNAPTQIQMFGVDEGGKFIDQGDYGCTLTNRRGLTDITTVNILHVFDIALPPKIICSHNLHNKGGYMVVTGNAQTGFKCDVYRDKVK